MEVRAGYKQTAAGVIPEDWRSSSMGDEADLLTGFPFASSGFTKSGVRLLRGSNVKRGVVDWSTDITQHWPAVEAKTQVYELRTDDLVIAMDGALVGRSFATVAASDLPALLVQRVARLRSKKAVQGLLRAWVASEFFVRHVDLVKTHTAIPHISPRDIREFGLVVPTDKAEQRAIAAALSDVDALLGGLDRLIAKKRNLKLAAMQQLLTGQTRLPGFHGEWEVKRLGDMLAICHGRNQREVEDPSGLFPIFATGGHIGTASRALYDKPSVLIGRKGTINQPRYMDTPFWTVDTLFYSAMKGGHNAKFLYYRFCLIDWMQYNEASGVPSLNARTIENVEVAAPVPAEQSAIAAVLSDLDAELTALEARRDKTRALKQGMMQELLTGRTRLV